MPTRRNIITLAAVGIAMPTSFARAAMTEFTMAAFKAAQKAGKPILVDVWASWCPTCVKCSIAEHLDCVQGRQGNRPLSRRY
jgi:thiol-disulfide isomerase/thioredoxin